MTEDVLVALISVLCKAEVPMKVADPKYEALYLPCTEKYFNCAIKYNKDIMTVKQFEEVCVK